jgi:glycosyltransferase involved in cell wall biosynthesis
LIVTNNLTRRVKIFTTFTYNEFIQKLKKSIIGLAIYEPTNLSHKYMIGASNKINFYMKYSLPIVLSKNIEQLNFIKKYKNGINVNHKDPKSIALGIKKLLRNKNKYKNMSYNSFRAFRDEFNFYNKFKAIKNFLNV